MPTRWPRSSVWQRAARTSTASWPSTASTTVTPGTLTRRWPSGGPRPSGAGAVHASDAYAWALHANGRHEEALRYSRLATRRNTQEAILWIHRGTIEASLGRTDVARRHLRAGIDMDPGLSPWQLDASGAGARPTRMTRAARPGAVGWDDVSTETEARLGVRRPTGYRSRPAPACRWTLRLLSTETIAARRIADLRSPPTMTLRHAVVARTVAS